MPAPFWRSKALSASASRNLASLLVLLLITRSPRILAESHEVGDRLNFARAVKVVQVINEEEMLVDAGDQWYWVKGIGTKKLADGVYVDLTDTVFKYAGTKSYSTALGARKTVYAVDAETKAEAEARKKTARDAEKIARAKEANEALRDCRTLLARSQKAEREGRRYDAYDWLVTARKRCVQVVERFPGTKAAEEAERILHDTERLAAQSEAAHAAEGKLASVKRIVEESRTERSAGRVAEANRLLARAKERARELIRTFPGSDAAAEAHRLLEELKK